ncbi:MAG: hypothetical protein AAGJ73_02235 [Pseudomonadota bacterium]
MFQETQSDMALGDDELYEALLTLDLAIDDPEVQAFLRTAPEGRRRDKLALTALRIGVLALKQAQGQIDATRVRDEGERLLTEMGSALSAHRETVSTEINRTLKDYFDPQSGRFAERVERLVKKDGDLERALREQVAGDGSSLVKTLSDYTGPESPIMRAIDPTSENGLAQSVAKSVEESAAAQTEAILKEFSLDHDNSALSRTIRELTQKHGAAGEALQKQVADAVSEFSLDREDSALSRLVQRVDRAQKLINDEFSLDRDGSALARMRKEMLDQIEAFAMKQTTFQADVMERLTEMAARKAEALRSTAHGDDFEATLLSFVQEIAQKADDIATPVGATTGVIRNCKKGDIVIEIGPENRAAGAKIVIEAKQDASYTVQKAREEIETGRKNRSADIGLFVFSKRTAPEGLDPLRRIDNDIFIIWDEEDEASDWILRAAISLAKAMAVRAGEDAAGKAADFDAIEKAVRAVEKQAGALEELATWGATTRKTGDKIETKARRMREALEKEVALLDESLAGLRAGG